MRVLCCLDGTNAGQVSKMTGMLSTAEPPTFGILFVTDTGPRHDIEHLRERFLRPNTKPPSVTVSHNNPGGNGGIGGPGIWANTKRTFMS
jgi:hypothetical protein